MKPVPAKELRRELGPIMRGHEIAFVSYHGYPRHAAIIPTHVLGPLEERLEAYRAGVDGAAERLAAFLSTEIRKAEEDIE